MVAWPHCGYMFLMISVDWHFIEGMISTARDATYMDTILLADAANGHETLILLLTVPARQASLQRQINARVNGSRYLQH